MNQPSTLTQKQEAYRARFGTPHPRQEQVMAWAKELFPEMKSLRFKTVDGRTALMDGQNVLGVGTDHVEAVASADIRQKQASVRKTGSTPTVTKGTPMPEEQSQIDIQAIRAEVAKLTRAVADLNVKQPPNEEINTINEAAIKLNELVGNRLEAVAGAEAIPPMPENPKPEPSVKTSDPAEITKALE